jgi:hypothetical protein
MNVRYWRKAVIALAGVEWPLLTHSGQAAYQAECDAAPFTHTSGRFVLAILDEARTSQHCQPSHTGGGMARHLNRYIGVGLAMFFIVGLTSAVRAEEKNANSDVSCLLIALQISDSSDPETKEVWSLGVTYFLGRVDMVRGDEPLITLVRQGWQRRLRMSAAEYNRERARCAALLAATGEPLTEVGKELKEVGKELERSGR